MMCTGASESGRRRLFEAPTSAVTASVTLTVSSQITATTHHSTSTDQLQLQQQPDICHCDNIDAVSVVRGQLVTFKDNVRRMDSLHDLTLAQSYTHDKYSYEHRHFIIIMF